MKNLMKSLLMLFMASAVVFTTACNNDDDENTNNLPPQPNIAEVATGNASLSILVDALTRTNLVGAVSNANASLTVFAPTNAAFEALLSDSGFDNLDQLEAAVTTDGLRNILLYHVLNFRAASNQVVTGYLPTLATNGNNNNLSVYISTASGVMLNNTATVTTADLSASNGVIHVIDAVITPRNIVELLQVNPDFSSLVAAVGASANNPAALLSNEDAVYTLFAPNNDGFGALLQYLELPDLNAVVEAVGAEGLFNILAYHIVDGNVRAANVTAGNVATLSTGNTFNVSTTNGVVITDNLERLANVVATDITAVNGTIHVIDNVILPE